MSILAPDPRAAVAQYLYTDSKTSRIHRTTYRPKDAAHMCIGGWGPSAHLGSPLLYSQRPVCRHIYMRAAHKKHKGAMLLARLHIRHERADQKIPFRRKEEAPPLWALGPRHVSVSGYRITGSITRRCAFLLRMLLPCVAWYR